MGSVQTQDGPRPQGHREDGTESGVEVSRDAIDACSPSQIDMNWMGMVKGATISLTVHNKGGWGEFSG